ncbi:MAG TPA: precorrin-3B synthase [Sporichthya sp.]|nr:precorrin-3B synthase [Sporichthya sp.]
MPTPRATVRREGADACPGVRSVWRAADGGLARVRTPGGRLTPAQLEVLAAAAEELGSGVLELTSRANVQVRGLRPQAEHELGDRLRRIGLLPSDAHDRVRNILASPLTGLVSDRPDVSPVVTAIDDGLLDDPGLAALPGRFLFAVDDGTGDVSGLDADVTLIAHGSAYVLLLGGTDVGLRAADPAAAALAAARGFLAERGAQHSPAWRLAELDDGPARVAARIDASLILERGVETGADPASKSTLRSCMSGRMVPPGEYAQTDGRVAVVLEVPDGRLDTAAARALATRSSGELRITPWRSVVLPNLESTGATA